MIDKGSGFHKRSMKSWLQDKVIKVYSTHNEGKPVVAEQFIVNVKFTNEQLQHQKSIKFLN